MIKNLVIQNIPKREEDLTRVLKIIGDHTWTGLGVAEWASCTKTSMIFYDKDCDCYVWSNQGVKPVCTDLVWKEFNQVIAR